MALSLTAYNSGLTINLKLTANFQDSKQIISYKCFNNRPEQYFFYLHLSPSKRIHACNQTNYKHLTMVAKRIIAKKRRVFSLALIAVSSFILYSQKYCSSSETTCSIPNNYIGNWINDSNNHWEYGFYENFAIVNCDFWDYHSINTDSNGHVHLELTKQDNMLKTQLVRTSTNQIMIKQEDNDTPTLFSQIKMACFDYSSKDTTPFLSPAFIPDSATIIGYYKDLNIGMKKFLSRFFPSPFEVSVYDFLQGEEVKYHTDIDRQGRFRITFPVMNTQELYVDWKRTRIRAVVEPGDSLFLFVDINDYLLTKEDSASYQAYVDRPKKVLFMGKNARLNNEIYQYKDPDITIQKREFSTKSDMEFLHACNDVYSKRLNLLNEHIKKKPSISDKFIFYKRMKEQHELAFNLIQRNYSSYNDGMTSTLQEGYFQFIEENFTLNNELEYTFTSDFGIFIRDYIYYNQKLAPSFSVTLDEVNERLKEENKLTLEIDQETKEINTLIHLHDSINENKLMLAEQIRSKIDQLSTNHIIKQTIETLQTEKSFLLTTVADSLILNPHLRELWTTNRYIRWFEILHIPLSAKQLSVFKQKVHALHLRNRIDSLQKHYEDLTKKAVDYRVSIKSTAHLKEYKEATLLWSELIKPYKGKVLYIDFWGTWCNPCRQDLKKMDEIKDQLIGDEVVFMYFANRSPEKTWENVIKEMKLSGNNIVHYRLPDEQQGMIERLLEVTNYPTYVLVNKDGKIITTHAERPSNPDGAIKQIKELLQ